MADRRFETSFKQLPGSDEPGLVLGDDDVVYLIKPDGTRVELGAVFNGGTVTGSTVYTESDPAATPVQFKPVAGATAALTDQWEVYDDGGFLIAYVDAAGNFNVNPSQTAVSSSIFLAAGSSGNPDEGAISFGGGVGKLQLRSPVGGSAILATNARAALVEATDGGHLGFFAQTPAAKPAVTGAKLPSDTVMASLLTALAALGLVTDSTT